MDTTATVPPRDTPQLKRASLLALAFVAVLWLVKFVEVATLAWTSAISACVRWTGAVCSVC